MQELSLSAAELEQGAFRLETLEKAKRAFGSDGGVLLPNAFPIAFIEELRRAFFARYGGHGEDDLRRAGSQVGHDRYMFAIELTPPFLDQRLYANPFAYSLARAVLGGDCVLDSFSAVVAYPGSADQHLHLDHSLLFEDDVSLSMSVPPYALTMVVPLAPLSEQTGSTRLFPKNDRAVPSLWSRWRGGTVVDCELGACWLMDYRVVHGGTKNPSQVPRPILYLVYSKKWFTDAENFNARARFDLPSSMRDAIPPEHRDLFRRARRE